MTQEQKAARAEAKAAKKAAMGTSDEPRQDTTPVRALGQWIERAPTKRDDHGLCIATDGGGGELERRRRTTAAANPPPH